LLTEATTTLGHGILSGVLRFDVNRLVRSGVAGVSDVQYAWGRVALVNTERMTAWLLIWPVAHFAMIVVGLLAGLKRLPVAVTAPVEVIPGGMLSWSVVRALYSFRRFERATASVKAARESGAAAPDSALRPDWRLRLVGGSDWEIVVFVILAAVLAWGLSTH
jgi:hypothetical protein